MRHQAHIVRVVTANVLQGVRELLTAGKQLLEVGETRRHWLTSRIDNGRIGQNRFNKRHMLPVIGQFIDEPCLACAVARR